MKKSAIAVACLVSSALLASMMRSQPTNDAAAIRQARAQNNAAIARKDFAAIAAGWTEDVSTRAGLGKDIQGRQAYLAAFRADSAMTYTREPIDVVVSTQWPLAYERGRWTGHLRGATGTPLLSGEYSAQWVRGSKGWLIRSELFVALRCSGPACQWPASAP
jgi:ketosteroid isomerase-like protein